MRSPRAPMLLSVAVVVVAAAVGLMPLRATGDVVQLRQRFFGHENVLPDGSVRSDRVILSWFGVTNFAASIGGHVVLLDAWVPRGQYSGYVPTSPAELAALEPEMLFVGHSHFDHLADAATIIAASGATLVGTPEHCAQVRDQAGASVTVNCIEAVGANAAPGATRELDVLGGVGLTVVKHVHSAGEPPDPGDTGGPHAPAGTVTDPTVFLHVPAPQDTVHLASHLADAENGTLLYQFRVGDFALTWHDSSGPLKERAPDVFDVMSALPPTDVQMGAIMGFNQITNGLRDPRMYVETLAPKIFVPTHHDNWAPGITSRGEEYRPIVEEELSRIPPERRPILRFIGDPQDYVRPEVLTFDVNAPFWA